MSDLVEVVAEGFEHLRMVDLTSAFARGNVARAALAALKEAGYEVIALPEPELVNDEHWWGDGDEFAVLVDNEPGVMIETTHDWRTPGALPAQCRSLAAALLAAANAAEEAS